MARGELQGQCNKLRPIKGECHRDKDKDRLLSMFPRIVEGGVKELSFGIPFGVIVSFIAPPPPLLPA